MKYLDQKLVDNYGKWTPAWGPVGEITYLRTYSRNGERWHETVARVVEGCYDWQERHCRSNDLPWDHEQACRSAARMYELIWDMKFLPPGRGLWSMGTPILEKSGAAANNCGFVSTKNGLIDAAAWLMDMLMLGVGVGFDTLGAGRAHIFSPEQTTDSLVISDSREGWIDSTANVIASYLTRWACPNFDYSQIRPAGQPIKGFGGTSSGPEPLIELHRSIRALFDGRSGQTLTEADIVDTMNLIGKCVVAGNVRRSAEIALGSPSDEFLDLKNYDKHPEAVAHRWASNNSVVMAPGSDYASVAARIARNGEPGILWLDNARAYDRMGRRATHSDHRAAGVNPCSEQTLEDRELCCLVETFPSRCANYYEYQEVLKYAYLYAKTVTTIPTHDERTNEVIRRNRRIGCSMSGVQEAITKFGQHEFYTKWCSRGYKYLRALDDRYSEWLQVNRSIKITSVKPSGTVSKLPGVTSGIHFAPSEYYYQVIRFSEHSPYIRAYRDAGYRVVDLAPNEPGTVAVYFPVRSMPGVRAEADVSAWEQLEHQAAMQHYWADNQVSATVKFSPEEAGDITNMLRCFDTRLKSVAFLPHSEHGFEHAPWQPIDKDEYDAYTSVLRTVDLGTVRSEHEVTDLYCDSDKCEIPST